MAQAAHRHACILPHPKNGRGLPGFHSVTADSLSRTGGWSEEANVKRASHGQDFAVFLCTYDTADHATAAAQDMVQTVNDALTAASSAGS